MYETILSDDMKPWRDLLLQHKFAVEELRTILNILDEEFRNIHDYNPIEHIRHRVKKPNNIMEKLARIGLAPTIENAKSKIFDIAGIRVVCAFTADIYRVVDLLCQHSLVEVIEIKDYIEEPKGNGYRSLHLHISFPVYTSRGPVPTRVEIQLRTIAMDFWASVEHKIYYKYRDKAPGPIQDELNECAQLISDLDNRMYLLRRQIEGLEHDPNIEKPTNTFYREKIHY